MSESKAVTVVLLCWNQKDYVRESITSIANQTSKDFDLIIVDNGSTDGSQAEIEETLRSLNFGAKLIFNATNHGIAKALNQALYMVKTRYFLPFAADDVMLANRIHHQVKLFDTLPINVGVLSSGCQTFTNQRAEGDVMTLKTYKNTRHLRLALIRGSQPPAPGAIIRTSVLTTLDGYDINCPFEDYDMWVRIVFELGMTIRADPKVVSKYRLHQHNVSKKKLLMASGAAYTHARISSYHLTTRERSELRFSVLSNLLPSKHWQALLSAISEGNIKAVRRNAFRAAIDSSVRKNLRAKSLVVVLVPRLAIKRVGAST